MVSVGRFRSVVVDRYMIGGCQLGFVFLFMPCA